MGKKLVTFSYDDGVLQDKRLVDIFNTYGVKGTFNLNYSLLGSDFTFMAKEVEVKRIKLEEVKNLYEGHEVAGHSLTHPGLCDLGEEELTNEIKVDKEKLEELLGYQLVGFAYPFGSTNETVITELKKSGYQYARNVEDTFGFDLPQNLYEWEPTCHHNHSEIFELIETFLANDNNQDKLFYIWGHSYEFDADDNWEQIEKICRAFSKSEEVIFLTNSEVLKYLM